MGSPYTVQADENSGLALDQSLSTVDCLHVLGFCLNLQQRTMQLLSHSFPLPSGMGRRIRRKQGKNSWAGMRMV